MTHSNGIQNPADASAPSLTDVFHYTSTAPRRPAQWKSNGPQTGRLHSVTIRQSGEQQILALTGDYAATQYFRNLHWMTAKPSFDKQTLVTTSVWKKGVPDFYRSLAASLCRLLLIDLEPNAKSTAKMLDVCLALADYSTISNAAASGDWSKTEVGSLISQMKYWTNEPEKQTEARTALVRRMTDEITANPVLSRATKLLIVPGHQADGSSQGEQLGAEVAAALGIPTVTVTAPVRGERKGDERPSLDGVMSIETKLDGTCLIIDDVVRSGDTFLEVARAARAAGATGVVALAGAKTARN